MMFRSVIPTNMAGSLIRAALVHGLLILFAYVPTTEGQNRADFAVRPVDTSTVTGLSVTLYCSIANLGSRQVFWSIAQERTAPQADEVFTLGPNTNQHSSYGRFQFVGNAGSGEFNLRISDVSPNDMGLYTCVLSDPQDIDMTLEATVSLLVFEEAIAPDVNGFPDCRRTPLTGGGKNDAYLKGDMLTLICTSSAGGIPLSGLRWVRVQLDGTVQTLPDQIIGVSGDTVTNIVRLELSSTDHQSFYKCIESHPMRRDSDRMCETPFKGSESKLDVNFAPEVTITPNAVNVYVLQTVRVTLSCTAYANPPLTKPAVIVVHDANNSTFYPRGSGDRTLAEIEITTADVGLDIFCNASNCIGYTVANVDVIQPGLLPTWLILVIIGAAGAFVLILGLFVCCVCSLCCKVNDGQKNRPETTPTTTITTAPAPAYDLGEMGLINGFSNEEVVMEENTGGGVAMGEYMGEDVAKYMGEQELPNNKTGPTYQNLNAAFEPIANENNTHL